MKIKTLIIFMALLSSSLIFSQPQKGKIGITAQLQSQQADFLVPIFVSDNFSLSPAVGLVDISNKYTDLSLGIVAKYHLFKEIVTPYFGARFGALLYIPKENDTITDLVFGPLFGGEYYFTEHFSVGVELQLNITASDKNSFRFGNPGGTNINTATAFFATIYF